MSRLILRLRHTPDLRLDLSTLTPDALPDHIASDLARLVLWQGNQRTELGEFFDVRAETAQSDTDSQEIVFEGDLARCDRIGWQMTKGTVRVVGDVGDYTGCGMSGGLLLVEGHAGMFTAAAMRDGALVIQGNTGDFAAAALPGDMEGMRGGTLTVRGDAGARLGDRMRRGTVMVTGNTGPFAASRMVAGTLAIAGDVGSHLGTGMRRGTVVLARATPSLAPTFVTTEHDIAVFWAMLARSLGRAEPAFAELARRIPQRHAGDLAVDGKGEILSFTA
jgi:formylmethanofuran dehydrogenase subunit C